MGNKNDKVTIGDFIKEWKDGETLEQVAERLGVLEKPEVEEETEVLDLGETLIKAADYLEAHGEEDLAGACIAAGVHLGIITIPERTTICM